MCNDGVYVNIEKEGKYYSVNVVSVIFVMFVMHVFSM